MPKRTPTTKLPVEFKPPMKFVVDGMAILKEVPLPPCAAVVLEFLQKLPDGQLLTRSGVSMASGVSQSSVNMAMCLPQLDPHKTPRFKRSVKKLYGNQKTIRAYREEYGIPD
jgi:hypothetical protein